jgi:hypothetical protein
MVDVGSVERISVTGSGYEKISLKDFVATMVDDNDKYPDAPPDTYLFDKYNFFQGSSKLLKSIHERHVFFESFDSELILVIGTRGTGVLFHFHKDAWLEVY